MLAAVREAVAKEVGAGKDLEAIRKANPLGPFVETWAKGFMDADTFLEIVVSDLSR